ncbi:MAG: hypothetical protein N2234_08020 [Planctomycetota bacterium]|nr:hypothetical protein [Planctomycetota bacterium]
MRSLFVFSGLVVALALLFADEAQKYEFASKLKKGDIFTKKVKVDVKASSVEEGAAQTGNMEMNGEMSVEEVDEKGDAKVTDKMTRIRFKGSGMGIEMEYDSDKPQEPSNEEEEQDMQKMMQKMLAQQFGRHVNKSCKTKISKLWHSEVEQDPTEVEETSFLGYLSVPFQLPEKPVAVGDTWEIKSKVKSQTGEETQIEFSVTLKEVQGTVAVFDGKVKKFDLGHPGAEIVSSKYLAKFNIEKGYPESVISTVVVKMKATDPATGEEKTIEQTVTYQFELKAKEEKKKEERKPEPEK